MQHTEWMALAVAKADGPRTLEELSAGLREWARNHVGPFELPRLTKAQRGQCLEIACRAVQATHTFVPYASGELYQGEGEYIDWLIDAEYRRTLHHMRIALLPIEVREEIDARRQARRF